MATEEMFSLLGIHTLSWHSQPEVAGGLANGYLSAALWDWEKKRAKSNDYISNFETTIEVPLAPRKKDVGLIYIFMGLETALTSPVRAIVQPVLQWGSGPAGGGPHWSLVSCYVAGDVTTPGDSNSRRSPAAFALQRESGLHREYCFWMLLRTETAIWFFSILANLTGPPGRDLQS
jgi:hypothetical protein